MDFLNGPVLHKSMYFNYYIYLIWTICNGLFLFLKLDYFKIPRLLVVTAYLTMAITFSIKLCLVHRRDFKSDISKLTRFFLLTLLIQMPLVSFFLIFFPLLLSTPLEVCLHVLLLLMTLIEGAISFFAAWKAVKHAAANTPRPYPRYYPPIEMQTVSGDCESRDSRTSRIFR